MSKMGKKAAVILSAGLVGMMSFVPGNLKQTQAAGNIGNTDNTDNTEHIERNNINLGASVLEGGRKDVIYFGQGDGSAFDWSVLDIQKSETGGLSATVFSNTGLFLGAGETILSMPWSRDGADNHGQKNYYDWAGSDIQLWLNGAKFYGNTDYFGPVENSMILPITSYSGDLGTSILNNYFYLPYSDDMSNEAYGFGSNDSRKLAVNNAYWLRNQGTAYPDSEEDTVPDATAVIVDEDGQITETTGNTKVKKDGTSYVVAPMTNLDLEKVLFTKQALSTWGSDFTVPEAASFRYWELTLLDDEQKLIPVVDGLKIDGEAAEEKPDLEAGQSVEMLYSYQCNQSAADRKSDTISVLITEGDYKNGIIKEYAQFPMELDETNKGTLEFEIPQDFDGTADKIYVLAEQIKEPETSVEYASAPADILQQTEKPKASPQPDEEGNAFADTQIVTLTCDTPEADIYYTTDGSTPEVDEDMRYTEPVSVTEDTVIKAIAVSEGKYDSEVMTWNYLIGITNITKLELSPTSAEMARGDFLPFIAAVLGDNIREDTVTWKLSGNTSADTKLVEGIGKTAILYTGEDETPGILTVTVTSDDDPTKSVTAQITVSDKYVVTVEAVDNGTVSVNRTKVPAGTKIVVTAVPNKGYKLQNILLDGKVLQGDSFTMPSKGVRVGAVFIAGSNGDNGSNGGTGGSSGGAGIGSSGSTGNTGGSKLASSNGLASSAKAAKTSDISHVTAWSIVFILSATAACVLVKKRRIEKQSEK